MYNAIRSGAVDSYLGVKRDWQREQHFRSRLVDVKMIEALTHKPAYATLIRLGFEQPIESDSTTAADQRVDAGGDGAKLTPRATVEVLTYRAALKRSRC